MGTAEISIITVAHESGDVLRRFVDAAGRAARTAEIVIVDNGSRDSGAELVSNHPQVRVLSSGGNIGFGRACNLGAEAAAGSLLVFANPDVFLSQCSLGALGGEDSFGLGAGIYSVKGGRPRSGLYRAPSIAGQWMAEVFSRLSPREMPHVHLPSRPGRRYVSGALFAARKDEFMEIGGFDRRFFMYYEDRDLSDRYKLAGFPLQVIPGLTGEHLHGSSSATTTTASGQAWSIVSWIEYVGIWSGQAAATALASRVLGSLTRIAATLELSPRSRVLDERRGRKAREYSMIRDRVVNFDEHLPPRVAGLYPHVRLALRQLNPASGLGFAPI